MAALRKHSSDTLKEIKELIDARRSCAEIAKELDIPVSTVGKIAAREGWKFNSAPKAKEARRVLDVDHIWDRLLRAKAK